MLPQEYTIPFQLILPAAFAMGLLLPFKFLDTRRGAWLYSAITSTISFCFTLYVAIGFNWADSGTMQYVGHIPWVESFGLQFSYGMDGVSIWLVMLTTFLMPIVVLGSLVEVKGDMRTFHFWLHVLEAALIGTFIARDIIFFYVCFEFTLIPLFFLIGIFGHGDKLRAAKVFFFYTFTGSLLTMGGLLYVAWFNTTLTAQSAGLADIYGSIGMDKPRDYDGSGTLYALSNYAGQWTFNIKALWAAGRMMSPVQQMAVMIAMVSGFGVKTPLFPFHTWLPLAHTEAPTAGSVDLAGLVLKLGPYGLLRLAIPMLPLAVVAIAPWLGAMAVIGVVYAALICWVQRDAKKLIAYSSVSHMGFCILGLFAFDQGNIGATGSVVYMIAHGLATGGLFLCIGMLYDRFHTREIERMSGLAKIMPLWAFFFCLFIFASVGLPGLNGFIGEFLTMLGTFNSGEINGKPLLGPWYAIIAGSGVILAAIYLLYLVGKIVFGPVKLPHWEDTGETGIGGAHEHDLSYRETMTLAPIAIACIVIGLAPYPLLRSIEPAVAEMTKVIHVSLDHHQEVEDDSHAKAPRRQDAEEAHTSARDHPRYREWSQLLSPLEPLTAEDYPEEHRVQYLPHELLRDGYMPFFKPDEEADSETVPLDFHFQEKIDRLQEEIEALRQAEWQDDPVAHEDALAWQQLQGEDWENSRFRRELLNGVDWDTADQLQRNGWKWIVHDDRPTLISPDGTERRYLVGAIQFYYLDSSDAIEEEAQ